MEKSMEKKYPHPHFLPLFWLVHEVQNIHWHIGKPHFKQTIASRTILWGVFLQWWQKMFAVLSPVPDIRHGHISIFLFFFFVWRTKWLQFVVRRTWTLCSKPSNSSNNACWSRVVNCVLWNCGIFLFVNLVCTLFLFFIQDR